MSRVATLRAFIAQRPDDPFPLYSLAMELKKSGDHGAAQEQFDELERKFPSYVPGYYHAAANLRALARLEDARVRYRAGIEVADRAGDDHARGELMTALAEIQGGS